MRLTGDKLFIMWEDHDEDEIYSCCEYDSITGTFLVSAYRGEHAFSEQFISSSSVEYGMNIDDLQQSLDIADKLILKIKEQDANQS